jgi:hypothetical protein
VLFHQLAGTGGRLADPDHGGGVVKAGLGGQRGGVGGVAALRDCPGHQAQSSARLADI